MLLRRLCSVRSPTRCWSDLDDKMQHSSSPVLRFSGSTVVTKVFQISQPLSGSAQSGPCFHHCRGRHRTTASCSKAACFASPTFHGKSLLRPSFRLLHFPALAYSRLASNTTPATLSSGSPSSYASKFIVTCHSTMRASSCPQTTRVSSPPHCVPALIQSISTAR
jgi:hypothetical protein